jgi:acyl-CoA thioesterase I
MKGLVHSLAVTALALAGFIAAPAIPAVAQNSVPLKIVAFGDSLTAGYGLPAQETFPARLERALKARGHNVEIENAGVSGDTTSGGLSRLDWSIADGTDAVIVELGANDMLRGVDPKVTRQALDDILAKLKARNIPVLLAGMRAAPNLGADYANAFETIFTDLASKYDVVFYPFFLDGVAAQARLALRDGMHPNAAGVEKLIARVKRRAPD